MSKKIIAASIPVKQQEYSKFELYAILFLFLTSFIKFLAVCRLLEIQSSDYHSFEIFSIKPDFSFFALFIILMTINPSTKLKLEIKLFRLPIKEPKLFIDTAR